MADAVRRSTIVQLGATLAVATPATVPVTLPAAPLRHAAPRFVLHDLGTLEGDLAFAAAVNDAGMVVGEATDRNHRYRGFFHHGPSPGSGAGPGAGPGVGSGSGSGASGAMQRLSVARGECVAAAINNRGHVAGAGGTWTTHERAVLWQRRRPLDLGTLGGRWSFAIDVNDADQVVGTSELRHGQARAFRWQRGKFVQLGPRDVPYSTATAIDQAGQVVGWWRSHDKTEQAFLWRDGETVALGDLGGGWSRALALNDRGEVVGSARTARGGARPFVWRDGLMQPLPVAPAEADLDARFRPLAINNHGWVVGADPEGEGARLWLDGVLHDLNRRLDAPRGWTLLVAAAVNDAGHIAAQARYRDRLRAVLLTPL